MSSHVDRRFSVAPMMDWTDRHERFFLRLITRRAMLYTEMVVADAILHGPRDRLLGFDAAEHPVGLQIGGAEPDKMAVCAEIAEGHGYDEININVGCPSDRVQSGRFGACLMAEPETVAVCVAAMRRLTALPVTVKSRIGIDDRDSYDDLRRFIDTVAEAGCATFIVHARKAWLNGLSPKQNREIPPLRHEVVHRLKQERPELEIVINGGLRSLADCRAQMNHVDGVMVGREAYQNPYALAEVDALFYGDLRPPLTRAQVVEALIPYVEAELARGTRLNAITRHLMGLFQGLPGARAWRRHLSENANKPGADADVLREALALVPSDVVRASA